MVREQAATQRARKSTAGLHLLSLIPCTRVTCTRQYWKNSDTQALSPLSLGQAHGVHQEHPLPILKGPPSIPLQCGIKCQHPVQPQGSTAWTA